MNEQIIDLYEQASLFASEEENPTKSYKDRVMIRFAELIVRECVQICEQGTATQTTSSGAAFMIKQHFGV
jgi:hypothetical protein